MVVDDTSADDGWNREIPSTDRRLDDRVDRLDALGDPQPQVVGRNEPLAEVDRFVGQIAERPLSLTIMGEPGIGKTTITSALTAVHRRSQHVIPEAGGVARR
jgi:DNA-binding NtrC family response regulator